MCNQTGLLYASVVLGLLAVAAAIASLATTQYVVASQLPQSAGAVVSLLFSVAGVTEPTGTLSG